MSDTKLPNKRHGETFSQYWSRITEGECVQVALASKRIGVTPQAIFGSRIREEEVQRV